MREFRDLSLPRMSRRAFLLSSCGLLGICVASGLGMRASLTDYSSDPEALGALRFQMSPATNAIVSLYSEESIKEELSKEGLGPDEYTDEEARALLTMPGDDVEELAPIILTGTFTGERAYAYQAFRCSVNVSQVIKGDAIIEGETITVYDPYVIRQPGFFSSSGGIFTNERVVSATADCYNNGMAPMREGQEYLLFLEQKQFPEGLNPDNADHVCILANHTYARIPLDVAEHPERIDIIDYSTLEVVDHGTYTETVMPNITFNEACQYDVFVQDEKAATTYSQTCQAIANRVLGEA